MSLYIKLETYVSKTSVNFLDVQVTLKNGKLISSVYSKPTETYLYVNSKSCHLFHFVENIPKVQFLRTRKFFRSAVTFITRTSRLKKRS